MIETDDSEKHLVWNEKTSARGMPRATMWSITMLGRKPFSTALATILLSLIPVVRGAAPIDSRRVAPRLPAPEVIAAWTQEKGKFGWFRVSETGYLYFEETDSGDPLALPAFRLPISLELRLDRKEKEALRFRAPGVPFGVSLLATRVRELQRVDGLDQMFALSIFGSREDDLSLLPDLKQLRMLHVHLRLDDLEMPTSAPSSNCGAFTWVGRSPVRR